MSECRETVPYVGPGPCVVELRDVRATTCGTCGHGELDVPERRRLDSLVGTLRNESLPYDAGRWRFVAVAPECESATPAAAEPH